MIYRNGCSEISCAWKLADMLHNSDLGRIPCPTEADRARAAKYQTAIKTLSQFCCENCGETLPLHFMSAKNTRTGQVLCDVCFAQYEVQYDRAEEAFWDMW